MGSTLDSSGVSRAVLFEALGKRIERPVWGPLKGALVEIHLSISLEQVEQDKAGHV